MEIRYIIGIDGGGTKTDVALAAVEGDRADIITKKTFKASNPNDVGLENALCVVSEGLDEVIKDADLESKDISSIFAGLAGCISRGNKEAFIDLFQKKYSDNTKYAVESDAANSIALTAGCGDGCCLIAGTGSAAFFRKNGVISNIGGWGYLVDDEGSGCSIGQKVLRAAYRSLDGRGSKTVMAEMVEKKTGRTLRDGLRDIYEGGKVYIASFAPIAFDAYRLGDNEAVKIIKNAEDEIFLLIKALKSHFENVSPVIAMCGGMFKEEDILLEPLRKRCGGDAVLIRPDKAPVYGALERARGMI